MPPSTEAKILEAAKKVFMEQGLYGARMQDIANKAGINKALLHYYFRSKERLFDEVFGGALTKYFQNMEVLNDASLSVIDRVVVFSEKFIDFLSEYPQMSLFLLKEMSANEALFREKVKGLKSQNQQGIIQILSEAQLSSKVDPILFMMQLHSMCAYPFLAAPVFKVIIEKSGQEWSDPQFLKLKSAVKQFIIQQLS
jgi:AcrR family transcriptional regulator